jgi:hypothetical protein
VTEELEVLGLITGRLADARIEYMLTGSMAMNYYAVPRMTRDIDLVVDVRAADGERLLALLGDDFYVDAETARAAIAARSGFNAIHIARVVKVDFVIRKDTEYRRVEFTRRRAVRIDEHLTLVLVAPEDLIISKLDWAQRSRSSVQLEDVRNLLSAGLDLDGSYLAHWVDRLGLRALYREVDG